MDETDTKSVQRKKGFHAVFGPSQILATPPYLSRYSNDPALSPSQWLPPSPRPSSIIQSSPSPILTPPDTMSQSMIQDDPFFYLPRQLAAHLLLTYPVEFRVSPAQLKHSIIIGNDVSGRTFLCSINGPGDLEALGVETLGARLWLWEEIKEMRKMSMGYAVWKGKQKDPTSTEQKDSTSTKQKDSTSTKRKRVLVEVEEPAAKRPGLARWAAVKTAKPSDDDADQGTDQGIYISDTMLVPDSSVLTEKMVQKDDKGFLPGFLPSLRSSTIDTMLTDEPVINWDHGDFQLGGLIGDKMMGWEMSQCSSILGSALDASTPLTSVSETVLGTPESILDATAEGLELGLSMGIDPALLSRSPTLVGSPTLISDVSSVHSTPGTPISPAPRSSPRPSPSTAPSRHPSPSSTAPSQNSLLSTAPSRNSSSTFSPPSSPSPSPHLSSVNPTRALRPRTHNIQKLPSLTAILSPSSLSTNEITTMLYALRSLPEQALYTEFLRAASVTARIPNLSPSTLALKTNKETMHYVHEMAAVYVCWVLNRPYPLDGVSVEDVRRLDFETFKVWRVKWLNALIPYDTWRSDSCPCLPKIVSRRGKGVKVDEWSSVSTSTPTDSGKSRKGTERAETEESKLSAPTRTARRSGRLSQKSHVESTNDGVLALSDAEIVTTSRRRQAQRQSQVTPRTDSVVTSDLPSVQIESRCPDTGFTSKQKRWGEAMVKRYKNLHKSRRTGLSSKSKRKMSRSAARTDTRAGKGKVEEEGDNAQESTPWGVNYFKGNLTPEGLEAFINWAKNRLDLLLWRYQKPKEFEEFTEKLLEMASQLASGIERLEELHRISESSDGI